ncbi:pfs ankyrin repeats & 6-phosphofructo-2-kinase [Colletotrichum asianum]
MADFPQFTIWELHDIHLPLGQWREVHEGDRKIVCDTLLKALYEKDRSETFLCFLTNNSLDSCLAQTHQCVSAALPLAAKQGWFEAVDALLDIGVDPLAEDEAGRTALSYCAEYAQFQHEVCAEVILRYGNALEASKSVSWLADGGRTPLLWAIAHGNDEMGSWRVSPLTEVFSRGFEGIALQLIDAGAELQREHLALAVLDSPLQSLAVACLRAQIVEFGDYWFQQMLEIIVDNDSDSLQLLFDLGVGVEFCHIVLAIRTGHHEVKQLFLDGFPGWVDANQHRTKHGLRRLEENDDHEIMQALLDNGGSAVWDHTQI